MVPCWPKNNTESIPNIRSWEVDIHCTIAIIILYVTKRYAALMMAQKDQNSLLIYNVCSYNVIKLYVSSNTH